MLASFMLPIDFNIVNREGVKFRSRACQRREKMINYCSEFVKSCFVPALFTFGILNLEVPKGKFRGSRYGFRTLGLSPSFAVKFYVDELV
jgi:hypothetical protein